MVGGEHHLCGFCLMRNKERWLNAVRISFLSYVPSTIAIVEFNLSWLTLKHKSVYASGSLSSCPISITRNYQI